MRDKNEAGRPVVFGEVLYDVFASGESVLGGAPFNVAWNLAGFGLDPLFISRAGDDERGRGVLGSMRSWGMDTSGVQADSDRPTGVVGVALEDGQPSFDIRSDQAYDFIDFPAASEALASGAFSILYHGTLIARSKRSRETLQSLRRTIGAPVFVDVNLRPPWWSEAAAREALGGASWAKLNHDELFELSGGGDVEKEAARLRSEHGLAGLIVTLGGDGAMIVTGGGEVFRSAPRRVEKIVDTVGAGDAFSAVAILGVINGWPPQVTLERAVDFAADVCGIRGAVSHDRGMYEARARQWGVI